MCCGPAMTQSGASDADEGAQGMVAARETTLQELLEGSRQYQVPLYQRAYSWEREQLGRLWSDVVNLAEDREEDTGATHFIGSLVLAPSPANGPAGVQEFLVVDGQQRLTTLSILLCALRDRRASKEDSEHRERINQQYLVNRWKPEQQRHKLVPTQADRGAYRACVDATPLAGGTDRVGKAYRYFTERLAADPELDLSRLEDAVMSGLALVSVTAQHNDNVHRIFESLNNTGLKLSQADLLRNYLFMRLPMRGELVHESVWMPLQTSLTNAELETLFWIDLVRTDPRIKQTDTYARQQARLDRMKTEEEIAAEVNRIARLGALLRLVLHPEEEQDAGVRTRLGRLQAWGTTTVNPLLLSLLDRRAGGAASSEEIARAMLFVESYLVRRMLIGRATTGLNRTLAELVGELESERPVDEAVQRYLSAGRKYFANDDAVRAAARSVPFYLNGRAAQRAQLLRWIEQSFSSKEPVELDTLTIEHVLPQTLTDAWRAQLEPEVRDGETVQQVHHELLHTLGNLTLTGYNSALSNSPFTVKRTKLAESGVRMSQSVVERTSWGREDILARAGALATRVIEVWPGPLAGEGEPVQAVWETLSAALAALPAGSWTNYGELAVLIGSSGLAVGQRIARVVIPNAHRVLQVDGTISAGFQWVEEGRTDDPRETLEAEGVHFDDRGRAAPEQRVSAEQLAVLVGLDEGEIPGPIADPSPGQDPARRDAFREQLAAAQSPTTLDAVLTLMDRWSSLGGSIVWGAGKETSGFLMARTVDSEKGEIWPITIRPSGRVVIPMKVIGGRTPFDNPEMLSMWEHRLNAVPGVSLRGDTAYPTFRLTVLDDPAAGAAVIAALTWFLEQTETPV